MNREEILNMQAGEELDILVAEKVMGWHKVNENNYLHWVDSGGHFQNGVGRYDGYEDDEDINLLKWHPSESIMWAWGIAEKLYDEGHNFKIHKSILEARWLCSFGHGFGHGFVAGDTASMAICRAALLLELEHGQK